jgi:hypothetical protein
LTRSDAAASRRCQASEPPGAAEDACVPVRAVRAGQGVTVQWPNSCGVLLAVLPSSSRRSPRCASSSWTTRTARSCAT